MKVAVIGGGIGGMAVAAAFARRGASVRVHERAPALAEVGAGLQVSVNGQRVLRALGFAEAPPDGATVSLGTVLADGARGRRIARVPPPAAGPTWYMHRADLLARLVDVAEGAGATLALGQEVAPAGIAADLVVAADGALSGWRAAVDAPSEARFTGQVAWRALVPGGGAPEAVVSMGRGAHVVSYPLRDGTLTNLVAVEERRDWTEEGWSIPGDPSEFRARFADFGGDVGERIARAERVHRWGLHLRPVAARWHRDNVALLGDAAHPTLPFMAQGACLALEDAWVLAAAVDRDGVDRGLARYAALRRDRAQRVVALARGNGWRFHLGKPWAWGAQAVLAAGAAPLARRLEWVYGYDATRAVG